ncbi:MAG: hypothetical protein K0R15_1487 [Clostridiales bacterium]|jgi:uncharacterized protein YehS (DUF1456 family)|nr:hypothetical protein [Clostridiales bacterium]
MNNNDILIRLRYALDIKDTDMVEIFKLGGIETTKEEVMKLLVKSKDYQDDSEDFDDIEEVEAEVCSNYMIESFLNGFIIFKRGKLETTPGQPERPVLYIKDGASVNNIMLKKLKIALGLSSEDMLDILASAGVVITKGELSAIFRKEGHKNYKECGDKYARKFLRGLSKRYRKRNL